MGAGEGDAAEVVRGNDRLLGNLESSFEQGLRQRGSNRGLGC